MRSPHCRTSGYIHGSSIGVGELHTIDVEMDRLYRRLEEFQVSSPKVYLMLRDLLKRITTKAAWIPPEAAVPSHGENFGLIDVEYFVQAEPSFDLSKYCG